jgi:PhnB protein
MQPIPYLFFRGTCEEAVRAYARVFGSPEPQIMHVGEAPDSMPDAEPHHVMHAALQVGDGLIYASDYPEATAMAGACIAVTQKTPEDSRRVFDALKEGGAVQMELAPTFWSPAFGQLTDRWGTRWMVDTETPATQAAAE